MYNISNVIYSIAMIAALLVDSITLLVFSGFMLISVPLEEIVEKLNAKEPTNG